jgi:hypothetical protein
VDQGECRYLLETEISLVVPEELQSDEMLLEDLVVLPQPLMRLVVPSQPEEVLQIVELGHQEVLEALSSEVMGEMINEQEMEMVMEVEVVVDTMDEEEVQETEITRQIWTILPEVVGHPMLDEI